MPTPVIEPLFKNIFDTRSEEQKKRDAEKNERCMKIGCLYFLIFIFLFITIATTSSIFCEFYPDTEWFIQTKENIQRMENQQEYEIKMNKVYCLNDNKPPCYTYAQLENFKRMSEVIERNQL